MADPCKIVVRKAVVDAFTDSSKQWPVINKPQGSNLDANTAYAIVEIDPEISAELLLNMAKGVSDAAAIASHFTDIINANPKPQP